MTGEPPPDAHSGGLLEHAGQFFAAGLEYLQARLSLVGIETKEALLHFGIIAGLLAGAISVVVFGYLFLCIAITVLLAQLLGISPGWVILGLAILHFIVAATAVYIAISRLKVSVFRETLAELKKDQQWLKHEQKQS